MRESATRCVKPKSTEKYREVCDGTEFPSDDRLVAALWWVPALMNAPIAEVADVEPWSSVVSASGMSIGPHFCQV